jgi:hypothetical protein
MKPAELDRPTGTDFYKQPKFGFLNDEERYRINVFDWRTGSIASSATRRTSASRT